MLWGKWDKWGWGWGVYRWKSEFKLTSGLCTTMYTHSKEPSWAMPCRSFFYRKKTHYLFGRKLENNSFLRQKDTREIIKRYTTRIFLTEDYDDGLWKDHIHIPSIGNSLELWLMQGVFSYTKGVSLVLIPRTSLHSPNRASIAHCRNVRVLRRVSYID